MTFLVADIDLELHGANRLVSSIYRWAHKCKEVRGIYLWNAKQQSHRSHAQSI